MLAILSMVIVYFVVAWGAFWFIPKRLARSAIEIPSTVPQEWVDQYQRDER